LNSRDPESLTQLWRNSVTLREALAIETQLPCDTTEADLFLNTWAALVAGGSMRQFQRRLSWDGLTLEMAANRIAAIACLPIPDPEPAWLTFTRQVLAEEREDVAAEFARHGGTRLSLSRRFFPACANQVEAFILSRLRDLPPETSQPVILRAMAETTLRIVDAVNLMGRRADADWKHAGNVLELSFPSHSGRLICRLLFEGGRAAFYKPRNLDLDRAFQGLIDWLRERERPCDWLPPSVEVVTREGYGWMPEVKSGPPNPGYDRKAGGLLAILYLLGGREVTWDHVIANPAGPVMVDAETVMQPRRPEEKEGDLTKMLPLWRDGIPDEDLAAHVDSIREGFHKCYNALLRHRGELDLATRFASCLGRPVLRAPDEYRQILSKLSTPPCLRSGLRRGAVAESLLAPFIREATSRPLNWDLSREEMDALDRWEIPSVPPPADACLAPPLEAAQQRLASLDEADRERQVSRIHASQLRPILP